MDVHSLGYRTDLALLQLGGSIVEDRGTHLVVRTPANPGFHWGNFLLLATPPEPGSGEYWLEEFHRELPEASHRAFGVDGTSGTKDDLAAFAEAGLDVDASSVMTASAVHEPPHPHPSAVVRPLTSDEDWAQQVVLAMAGEAEHYSRGVRDPPEPGAPGQRRGGPRQLVRGLPRRSADGVAGHLHGQPPGWRASRRSRPIRTPAARDWPARWCTPPAGTRWRRWAPARW